MDFTLNNMTLLGLTLAVGIVIDDAIVVLENIFRYIEEKHSTPFEAAIQATREVALPVMATTLSLVVIFLPVAFMTGYAAPLHLPVRLDDGVRDHGVDARQLHADADAELAVPEAGRRRARHQDQGQPVLPAVDRWYTRVAELVAGAPDGRSSARRGRRSSLTVPAQPGGRPHVRARRGHGRDHRARRHAAGHVARRDDARSREQSSTTIAELEGVAQMQYLAGAERVNHFHVFVYLEADRGAERHAGRRHGADARRCWPRDPAWRRSSPAGSPLGGGEGNFPIRPAC